MLAARLRTGFVTAASRRRPKLSLSYTSETYRGLRLGIIFRAFAATSRHRNNEGRVRTVNREASRFLEPQEGVKPETVKKEKPADPANQDVLLTERTVSNKEQRKADWAIMKEMARYLWPKDNLGTRFRVGLSVALLVGAKVA